MMNFFKSLFVSVPSIDVAAAKQRIQDDPDLFVLDVREPFEFKGGSIRGAKNIPLSSIGRRMQEVPKDQTILCVCHSGARSAMAAKQLKSAGYEVINMQGGMGRWESAGYAVKRK